MRALSLLLSLLLLAVASQAEYNETQILVSEVQICSYLTTTQCFTPACADCEFEIYPVEPFNVTLIKMEASVQVSLPPFKVTFPRFRFVDSIRLPNVVPIVQEEDGLVSQMTMMQCEPHHSFFLGKTNLFLQNGTIELALKEPTSLNRLWPVLESTCGNQGQVNLLWHH